MDRASILPRVLRRVVLLNVAMLIAEVAIALASGSVSLLADSVDFGEDASINLLVLVALSWSAAAKARLGAVLAGVLLMPTVATAVMAFLRFDAPTPPSPLVMALTTTAAFAVNATCATLLAKHRSSGGSLTRAAFLSARNDMLANVAILVAAGLTAATGANWPDLATGCAIGLLNAGAAWEVWEVARRERVASDV